MTQVDFYILRSEDEEARLHAACRIAEKAFRVRQHVVLRVASDGAARQLDELLWTFSQNSFVPHRVVGPTDTAPGERVLIARQDLADELPHELMINLADEVPESFSRYLRLIEVVDAEPARRNGGRTRYRFYRDRGYELKTHDI